MKKILQSLAIVIIFIAGIFGIILLNKKTPLQQTSATRDTKPALAETTQSPEQDDDTPVRTVPPVQTPPPTPTTNVVADSKKHIYKDGTYSSIGTYNSPAGLESINVSVTLKNDIVVNSSVTALAENGRSKRYQQAFIEGYASYVNDQNISGLNLDTISGASLTPIGFNAALEKIKASARS